MTIPFIINAVIVFVFALSYCYDMAVLGFSTTTPIINRITYMMAHTNLIHLLINLLSFDMFYFVFHRLKKKKLVVVAFVCAFLATFGTEHTLPTVGLSGVVYAMFGITLYYIRTKEFIFACICSLLVNIVFYFFANTNAPLHLISFTYAFLITLIINQLHYEKKETISAQSYTRTKRKV